MTNEKKVRLRSDEELEIQNEGLIILKDTLDKIRVKYYLSSGTLLGAIRENNFIRWDWDVQMYLLMEEAYPMRNEITKLLIENGFIVKKLNDSNDSLKWVLLRKKVIYELTGWYLDGEWRYRKNKMMRVPSNLFENRKIINFRGTDYFTFNSPEKYLEFCYGDWKTPKRTSNKAVYATSNHMKEYTFINNLITFSKKIILRIKLSIFRK